MERLRPIFMFNEEVTKSRQLGGGLAASIIIAETGLTRQGLLADRLTKVLYDNSNLTLQECCDLPVDRLATMIGRIVWDEVMTPEPPLGICMNCGHEDGEDHVCWHMDDEWGLAYEESVDLDQKVAILPAQG